MNLTEQFLSSSTSTEAPIIGFIFFVIAFLINSVLLQDIEMNFEFTLFIIVTLYLFKMLEENE